MTSLHDPTQDNLTKFQYLLCKLFQFDCADLDFGIYRIMNHKRDVVERFIYEQLPVSIRDELNFGALAQQAKAQDKLDAAVQQVRKHLHRDAIDDIGNLDSDYHRLEIGREYLEAQRQAADGSRRRDAIEADIYNHLCTFFSRYYDDCDFISKRRYSRNQRYAIPYNGEEVYLHWANYDQYYIKSDEYFRNYDWKAPNGVTVRFRVSNAEVEQNNVKGDKRFFMPLVSETEWDAGRNVVTIPFEYRSLNGSEEESYGRNNQQEGIVKAAVSAIPKQLSANARALAALMDDLPNGKEPVSHLEHHLRQYVRRNDSDFFIHKDLSAFLNRELNVYLKNEVLNLDNLVGAGQDMSEGWFQQMRLTKAVGSKIIDLLAQIEGFQKMLWEKRKFVIETQFCVQVGIIDETFFREIAECDAQWDEWRELHALDVSDRSESVLRAHPTLMLDSSNFDTCFTDRLLSSFDDLDDLTDGLLVHSENWQTLNLLGERYKQQVQAIYVDPPYNTDASAILYKNGYKDSSWLTMMMGNLQLAREFLPHSGVLCCAIDDEEVWRLRALLQKVFERELGIAPVRSNPVGRKSTGQFSPSHEYALFYGRKDSSPGPLAKTDKQLARYPLSDENGRYAWLTLIRQGSNDKREDAPKMFYPIIVGESDLLRIPRMEWDDSKREYTVLETIAEGEEVVWPVRDGVEKNWHRGWERVQSELEEYQVRRSSGGEVSIQFKTRMDEKAMPSTWWGNRKYASSNHGAKVLKELFLESPFDYPKSVPLVEDCIRASSSDGMARVMDYFAGSGTTAHAVVNLNREDGGKRKFVLVEMGEYFDTVLLPRIKKVTFSPEWIEGMPKRQVTEEEVERSPRIVKYLRLESYEDALDSIEFKQSPSQKELAESDDEYVLKYMLQWETKDSATLLNVAELASPFSYRLRVHVNGEKHVRDVDLGETFNLLLGMKVRKREVYSDNGRRYLVYRGETRERAGHNVAVIWRKTEGWDEEDFERDRDFIFQNNIAAETDTIYLNGDSSVPNAKPIEPLFKERMFATLSQ